MMAVMAPEGIGDLAESVAAAGAARNAEPTQALKDFESLFVETLLRSGGLAQTFESQAGPEGGMAGELMVREIARSLADQLRLDFGRSLGIGETSGNDSGRKGP